MGHLILSLLFLQDPVPGLIERLRTGSIEEREAAESALLKMGTAPAPRLEEAAKAGDPEFRIRARRLLSGMGVSEALIEDLRSDLVRGNARRARELLARRKDETGLLERLLSAAESDDDQQAIQAASVLLPWGGGPAALKRAPELLERSVAAFARTETRDYEWIATEVMLQLAAAATPDEVDLAFARALRGISPQTIAGDYEPTPLGRALELARSRSLPLPAPLVRHALLNLRHDEVHANAAFTRAAIEKNRALFQPALTSMVRDPDVQARRLALEMLLDWKVTTLPPGSPDVLGEMLARDARALPLLCGYGEEALPILEGQLRRTDYRGQFEAASGLLALRPAAWRSRVIALALPHLATDGFRGNAKLALELLIRCGAEAAPAFHDLLLSRDEQAIACAAVGLIALGEKPDLNLEARRRLCRLAARRWGQDEESCVVAALGAVDGLWDEVAARLTASGEDGKNRVDLLYKWMIAQRTDGWLQR